jgi:hypothetical protein
VRECLDAAPQFTGVRKLPAGAIDPSALSADERAALEHAVGESTGGLVATSGGPKESGGVISEAPVRLTELFFFDDAQAAKRAEADAKRAVGSPSKAVLNGVRAVGPVMVAHLTYGIGDAPGGVPLNASELAPVESCLRKTGYL